MVPATSTGCNLQPQFLLGIPDAHRDRLVRLHRLLLPKTGEHAAGELVAEIAAMWDVIEMESARTHHAVNELSELNAARVAGVPL